MSQRSLWQKFRQSYLNLWSYKIRKCSTESGEKKENDFKLKMKSVNEVKLLGHVGMNPKKYETKHGSYVTYFRMATSRYYYDKSEWLSLFGDDGILCDYCQGPPSSLSNVKEPVLPTDLEVKQTVTNWHAIIVRRPFLQDYVIKYVSKGARVYISGYLDDFSYDFVDELVRGPVHVVAEEVIFLKKPLFSEQENSPYFCSNVRIY